MKTTLSYIAIIATSAFAGNMIHIGLSYGAHWKTLEPIAFMEAFKLDFSFLLIPTAATLLPAFISTFAVFFLSERKTKAKKYWRYAFASLLIINLFTAGYFLPINLGFIEQSYPAEQIREKLTYWLFFHWIRIMVCIGAAIFTIKAFAAKGKN